MTPASLWWQGRRRIPAISATVALHIVLILLWQLARQHRDPVGEASRMQWVDIALQPPPPPSRPAAVPPKSAPPQLAARPPAIKEVPIIEASLAPVEQAAVPAQPAPSAADVLQRARKDLAGIDKQLGKEFPGARIKTPLDSPLARLEKGIEEAAELAPPAWYEQAKIKEIKDAGGYSRRRYRVITSKGTYCVTYESNHAPDGIDTMQRGIKPKVTSCPVNFDGSKDQW
jgi:hypothetical protein